MAGWFVNLLTRSTIKSHATAGLKYFREAEKWLKWSKKDGWSEGEVQAMVRYAQIYAQCGTDTAMLHKLCTNVLMGEMESEEYTEISSSTIRTIRKRMASLRGDRLYKEMHDKITKRYVANQKAKPA